MLMKRASLGTTMLLAIIFTVAIFMMGIAPVPAGLQAQQEGGALGRASSDGRFAKVSELIMSGLEQRNIPSVSIAVSRKGRLVWGQSFGWADREKRIKASTDTVYSLASTTKPMTATALMVLVRAGKVDLDAPVERYIGQGQLTVYEGSAKDVTIRRLLHHTAGLPQHFNYFYSDEPDRPRSLDETIQRFAIIVRPPGEVFQYANLGMAIIGHVIARVSGKSLAEFMREDVYQPLGMTSAMFDPDLNHSGNIAVEYDNRGAVVPFHTCDTPGAGNGYASVRDLIRFGMFHLKDHLKGQRRILDDAAIDKMQTEKDGSRHRAGGNEAYGLGWFVGETANGTLVVWHEGGWTGASAILKLVPSEDTAVAVLMNVFDTEFVNRVTEETIGAVLPGYAVRGGQADRAAASVAPPSFDLPAGTYSGEIRTFKRAIPLILEKADDGEMQARIGDPASSPRLVRDVPAAVSRERGQLLVFFQGPLGDEDSGRCPHNIVLNLRWVRDELVGAASAMKVEGQRMHFWLPYRVSLKRTGPQTFHSTTLSAHRFGPAQSSPSPTK
jgi:CubicO group peptidase (beta-lactamase class C family)